MRGHMYGCYVVTKLASFVANDPQIVGRTGAVDSPETSVSAIQQDDAKWRSTQWLNGWMVRHGLLRRDLRE